ncbi:MAG: DASH family cryptochrome [Candidatus Saccharibacteria bacterium]|nr:DASH family cryptochrome [Moraxellaceae bacterium]
MLNIVAKPVESSKKKLLWLTNNLRTHDSFYWQHMSPQDQVVAVYCIEPTWLQATEWGWKKMEVFRAQFLLETLIDLQQRLADFNIALYVFMTSSVEVIPLLHAQFDFDTILCQQHWTKEETQREDFIKQALPQVKWLQDYDRLLIQPQHLPFAVADIPNVFTKFRLAVEANLIINPPTDDAIRLNSLTLLPYSSAIPSITDLGYHPFTVDVRSACKIKGGEQAALNHVQNYLWEQQHILRYKLTRNRLIGADYSSKFSPWLANGSLSVRTLYQQLRLFEQQVSANESTYWMFFELLWRDYFSYISLKSGSALFKQQGILSIQHSWFSDSELTKQWISGYTEYDFVNANMIELGKTGWMSNRGRQNVASYWAKEKQQDWRIGASYFEAMLIDYDVHSNYANWNYLAGVGNDPRNRKFNIHTQRERYDPQSAYCDLWLSCRA